MPHVKPMLVLRCKKNPNPDPDRTAHFTTAFRATPEEVKEIFAEEGAGSYQIGASVDDETIKINLNLEQFAEDRVRCRRSECVWTFLTLPPARVISRRRVGADLRHAQRLWLHAQRRNPSSLKGWKQLAAISSRVALSRWMKNLQYPPRRLRVRTQYRIRPDRA